MKPRTRLLLYALALATLAWVGVALAQAASGIGALIPDLAALFVSPFALAAAIAPIVQVLKKHFLNISGLAVFILSLALGALLGLGGVWAGYLEGTLIEGAAFGVIAGLIASGAYDLLKEFLARLGIQWGPQLDAAGTLALTSGGAMPSIANAAVQFVLDLVRQQVSRAQLPAAINAVAPLVAELLQSPVVLTDDTRSELQARVLSLLKKAGLKGADL